MSRHPQKSPMCRVWGQTPFRVAVIHGGPGAAGELEPVAKRLSEKYGVLEPLQCARSLDGQVEELYTTLCEHAKPPVILLGHSWGAWLSIIVAARFPALVKKLIVIGCGPLKESYASRINCSRMRRLSKDLQQEYHLIIQQLHSQNSANNNRLISRLGELVQRTDSYDAIDLLSGVSSPELAESAEEIYRCVWPQAAQLRATGDLLAMALNLQCPMVAIHGNQDPHPVEGVMEPLVGTLREFRMIQLDKCGHNPWLERHAMNEFYAVVFKELH